MRSSRVLASRELAVIRAAKHLTKYRSIDSAESFRLIKARQRLDRAVNMLIEYERKHKP